MAQEHSPAARTVSPEIKTLSPAAGIYMPTIKTLLPVVQIV